MMRINPKAEKIIEGSWYPAKIGEVEDKDTQFGESLVVPFNVEADGDVVEIAKFLSYSDHPKSNMVKWGKALFGDGPFDTEDFSGVECDVFVEEGEDKEGSPRNVVRKVRRRKDNETAKSPEKAAHSQADKPDFEDDL
jgi:hypothetical protein